jgi:peptidyl-prolyl cis-trans isomerase SurA
MKRWFLIPCLLALWASPVFAVTVDGLAAVVDDQVITRSELKEALSLEERSGQVSGPDAKSRVLEGLIENLLVEREAKRLSISVSDEEVLRAVEDIRTRNGLDDEAFRSALAGQGMDYGAYLDAVRTQILRVKVAARVLRSKLDVGDEALREFYLKNVADFCEAESVRLVQIQTKGPEARESAEEARSRVLAGEKPEAVARELGSPTGGDMGYVLVKNLAEQVRKALHNLEKGEVSGVVEMNGSCSLFVVADRREGRIPPFEEVREQIREQYFEKKQDELYRTWIESLKEKAQIVRKM